MGCKGWCYTHSYRVRKALGTSSFEIALGLLGEDDWLGFRGFVYYKIANDDP